jgi:hypothetical protein
MRIQQKIKDEDGPRVEDVFEALSNPVGLKLFKSIATTVLGGNRGC